MIFTATGLKCACGNELPDLNGALDASYKRQESFGTLEVPVRFFHRADQALAHISDLAGCDRETWARRNNVPLEQPDTDTRVKFDYGLSIEQIMLARVKPIVEDLGWKVITDQLASLSFAFGDVLVPGLIDREMTRTEITMQSLGHRDTVYGHPDYVLVCRCGRRVVVDCKTTTFFPTYEMITLRDGKTVRKPVRTPDSTAKYMHRLQTAAYALCNDAEYFGVWSFCRESGMRNRTDLASFWYKTSDYLEILKTRVKEVLERTAPGAPEPPIDTGFPKDVPGAHIDEWLTRVPPAHTYNPKTKRFWKCDRYCSNVGCSLNGKGLSENAD